MNRRAFLSIAAGAPLVFGLRELLAQESAPDFVTQALKRMKRTGRFGVFLILPDADADRQALGKNLLARMPIGSKAGRTGFELFCANVFVCLSADQAAKAGLKAKSDGPGLLRILLDPEGKTVAADSVALDVFAESPAFSKSFATFINGADGARLRDRALAIEKGFTDELKKSAEQIRSDGPESTQAMESLGASADSIAPWFAQKSLEKDGARFEAVLWNYYMEQAAKDPEPSLPFGIKVERVVQVEDPCPGCGMAVFRRAHYKFLKFLTP
jgi:hypothetical protein